MSVNIDTKSSKDYYSGRTFFNQPRTKIGHDRLLNLNMDLHPVYAERFTLMRLNSNFAYFDGNDVANYQIISEFRQYDKLKYQKIFLKGTLNHSSPRIKY
jgi:hypothetical protein